MQNSGGENLENLVNQISFPNILPSQVPINFLIYWLSIKFYGCHVVGITLLKFFNLQKKKHDLSVSVMRVAVAQLTSKQLVTSKKLNDNKTKRKHVRGVL